MNVDQLKKDLIQDEGIKLEIYEDHLGLPTHGIGHLITEWDEEYGKPVGTPVSEDRVNQCFVTDVQGTIQECKHLYSDFDVLPPDAQLIIANMMYNMGRPRLSRFHKMKKAVDARDWNEAALQMQDSRWYHQVPNRAERLVQRMRNITV
tara:strand:+ start:88 stop:534 length:447 start_codon:yes stop_codon:yes gene_type:complete